MLPARLQRSQTGFTLIEVLVAALITMVAAAGAATAFASSLGTSGGLRARSQAQSLAEQSESRLRGMDVDQLSNLDQTRTVTIDSPDSTSGGQASGLSYSIHETAQFVSDQAGQASCTNPSADYLETTSTVTWPDMRGAAPVTATGLLTPTIGSIDSTRGTLAVSVVDDKLAGVAGARVSITGQALAAATTGTNGCVLFGDLPVGAYTVSITPPSGTWVDASTGTTVSVTNPEAVSATVNAGSTASSSTQVQIGSAGTAKVAFTSKFPPGVVAGSTPATAPAAVFFNTSLKTPSYRLCGAVDATCPPVGTPDTSFPQGSGTINGTPLFPYTYSVYAGVCSSDAPVNGDKAASVKVTSGQTAPTTSVSLGSMVIRLYQGPLEVPLPAGSKIAITDTGCGVTYLGYLNGTTPPTLTAGQAAIPLTPNYVTGVDPGVLTDPGMPDGNYSICYQGPAGISTTTVTNSGSGEIIPINTALATTPGTC